MSFSNFLSSLLIVAFSFSHVVPCNAIVPDEVPRNLQGQHLDVNLSSPLAKIIKSIANKLRKLAEKNIVNERELNTYLGLINSTERASTVLGRHEVCLRLFYTHFKIPRVQASFGDEILPIIQEIKAAAKTHGVNLHL